MITAVPAKENSREKIVKVFDLLQFLWCIYKLASLKKKKELQLITSPIVVLSGPVSLFFGAGILLLTAGTH